VAQDIHELVAGYALDALDDSGRREFEEHLHSCERCSREVESLREAAAALAYVTEGPAPPPELRARLLERVHEEGAPNVVPLRRRFALPAVATVAVAAAAAAIVLGIWASSLSNSLDRKSAMARVLGDPGAARLALGRSSQLIVRTDGEAVVVSRLTAPPAGKTYEIWVITKGLARPAGLFAEGTKASPVLLGRHVPRGSRVGLSIERHGGAGHPTHILYLTATV
jgi:anti-sigma-K factor RskA